MTTAVQQPDSSSVPVKFITPKFTQGGHKSAVATAETFERLVTASEVLSDLLAVALGVLCLAHAQLNASVALGPGTRVWHIAVAVAVLAVLMLERSGTYRRGNSLLRVKETERAIRVVSQLWLTAAAVCVGLRHVPWLKPVTVAGLSVAVLLICEKHLLYLLVRFLHARGKGVRRVVIVGAGSTGRKVFAALGRSPKLGLEPIAIVDQNPALKGTAIFAPSYRRERSVTVKAGPITAEMLRAEKAGALIVAIPSIGSDAFAAILDEATKAGVVTAFVPNRSMRSNAWLEHADIDGLLISSFEQPKEHRLYSLFKRAFDVVVGVALLIPLFPLGLLLAILIQAESAGKALFVQERVGKGGTLFKMYKFRSMYSDAQTYTYSPKAPTDQRITKIGRFLRRTSLDELPQLLNVIKGDMSLVGPRPEMPFIVEQYSASHWQRLRVKPGITGLWQISADRAFLIHENIEYDLYYIRNRGFFMDIAILLHTVFFAMRGI